MADFIKAEVDVTDLEQNLQRLSDKELIHTILMKGTKEAAKYLQGEAKESLLSKIPTANIHNPQHDKKWHTFSKPLIQGVKMDKMKYGEGYYVSILPDIRNVWFENGTQERMTKGSKITGYGRKFKYVKGGGSGWTDDYHHLARTGKPRRTGRIKDGKFTFFNPALEANADGAQDRITTSVFNALKKYGVE